MGLKDQKVLSALYVRIKRLIAKHLDKRVVLLLDTFISFVSTAIILVFLMIPQIREIYCKSSGSYYNLILVTSLIYSALMFLLVKSHHIIIRYSSFHDVMKLALALAGKEILISITLISVSLWRYSTIAILLADFLLSFFFLILVRILMITVYYHFLNQSRKDKKLTKVLVFGTLNKAVSLLTRLQKSQKYKVCGFLTASKDEDNLRIANNVTYYFSDKESFSRIVDKLAIDAILFADDNDVRDEHDRCVKFALQKNMKVLVVPSLEDASGHEFTSRIREVRVEDLLGREEIKISMDKIIENFAGKTVMVTGAAGSIGSELCRQLAKFGVSKLILYDNAETPMHNLRLSLEESFPKFNFVPVIGDVRHKERLDFAFRKYKPQVVFHAAAYKHVPLMEENPCEAVLVNVFGSRMVAEKCVEYGVEKMVMISTDKAVNPTNVMGCSKRLAEIYVQSLGTAMADGAVVGKTKFVTTRFGNVLGSNGSVIPRFRDQIAAGGPVTVTHPDITRFFMTIPEACRLVLEAATMSAGNDIFVFDMGKSVKIDTLARRMIELSGFVPDVDIMVEYTGLRPGEKLYEEVLADLEGTTSTSHDRIRVAQVRPYDYSEICGIIDQLADLAIKVDIMDMVKLMKKAVPEYRSKNSVYEVLDLPQ